MDKMENHLLHLKRNRCRCEMAVTERPDIILMDLEMPVMDGWEAARRLKSTPVLSAHALAGERDKALAAGCDEFVPSPSSSSVLLQRFSGFVR
jgi:CheY-like chemotaxis protein